MARSSNCLFILNWPVKENRVKYLVYLIKFGLIYESLEVSQLRYNGTWVPLVLFMSLTLSHIQFTLMFGWRWYGFEIFVWKGVENSKAWSGSVLTEWPRIEWIRELRKTSSKKLASTPIRLKYQIRFQKITECSAMNCESNNELSIFSLLLFTIMFSISLRTTKGLRYCTVNSLVSSFLFFLF